MVTSAEYWNGECLFDGRNTKEDASNIDELLTMTLVGGPDFLRATRCTFTRASFIHAQARDTLRKDYKIAFKIY